MKRSKGIRNRTRTLLRRNPRDRGKNPLGRILTSYAPGQMVTISINPSIQKGMPHRRYHGRVGMISEKRGKAYAIQVVNTLPQSVEELRPFLTVKGRFVSTEQLSGILAIMKRYV